jgi:uncharacterized protein
VRCSFMDAKLHGRHRNLKTKQLRCQHVPAGVAGRWNEAVPGKIAPMRQAEVAAAVLAACGGFSNAEVSKRTPYIADLKPAGRFVAKDLFDPGTVPPLMKTLLDNGFMHGDCMTVTGCTMAENVGCVAWNPDQDVVRPANHDAEFRSAGRRGNRTDRRSGRDIFANAPSRSGRRATAPSPILSGRPRRRAMRISECIVSVVLLGFGFGLTAAYALDGTPSPANVAPAVGVEVTPGGAPSVGIGRATPFQAFQKGARALQAGDTKSGLEALEYAARNGEVMALWKLGRMYADGDGVKQSDQRAFEYFRSLADSHAEETPGTTPAVFVAKAFVEIGSYYLTGIPSYIKTDAARAHQMFSYAASYFGDPDAQYRLGRTYLDGQGTAKSPKQAARWLSNAAGKGQYQAQAVLGAMLFKGETLPRDASRGLMYLILARDFATPKETWIAELYNAAVKQATPDEQAGALVHVEHWIEQSRSGHHP